MSRSFIDIDDDHTGRARRLWKPAAFVEAFPQIAPSLQTLRKQIERRASNALLSSGAIVETRLGCLVDANAYGSWILQPRQSGPLAPSAPAPAKSAARAGREGS